MFGYEPGEVKPTLESMSNVVHPDDLKIMYAEVDRYFKKEISHYSHDFKMIKKDGTILWTRHRASAIFDSDGKPIRMIGTTADISDIKIAHEKSAKALKVKEILIKEIHHRVKNNLQIISSLIRLQKSKSENKEVIESLDQTSNRIHSMALLHQLLYKSNNFTVVNFHNYVKSLLRFLSISIDMSNISVQKEILDANISFDTATNCGMIIMELLTNSIKYAFPNKGEGMIYICFTKEDENKFKLIVKDNGIGFPKNINFRETDSLGMQIVTSLTEQLEGEIEMIADNGTSFELTFQDNH